MKIKIIKSSSPYSWYLSKKGQIFNVVEDGQFKHLNGKGKYVVKEINKFLCLVVKECDCEIIK